MHTNQFAEHFNVCEAFLPVNIATAANDGDWVSLKNYSECTILFFVGPGGAAEPATITLEQATAVAGTSAKALTAITTVYQKQATTNLQGTGTWSKVTQAAAATYALGSAANGDKAALVAITIHAEDLDGDNGFDCLRARVADVGTGPAIGSMVYILGGPRHTALASAIVD
jgi:hypothetical protein